MSEKNESTLFRKKPVVVQAVQYPCEHPALQRCSCGANSACSSCGREFIQTLEGRMNVSPGDWIITGVQGEHYPCKPDIFAATYEPAAAPAPSAPGDAQDDETQAILRWIMRTAESEKEDCGMDPETPAAIRNGRLAAIASAAAQALGLHGGPSYQVPAAGDALPTIKGAAITGGYVVVTPAGWGEDKAQKVRDAILRLFPVDPAYRPKPEDAQVPQQGEA